MGRTSANQILVKKGIEITGDEALKLKYDAVVWDDLRAPASQLKLGATFKPDFNFTDVTVDFDDGSDETVYIIMQMPHGWKIGSDISPHVHWLQNQNQNIPWKLEYRIQELGQAKTVAWTTIALDQPKFAYTSGTIHQLSDPATDIDMSSIMTMSAVIQFKLTRDVSEDSYVGDAQVLEFDVHYQIDTIGSEIEYSKEA